MTGLRQPIIAVLLIGIAVSFAGPAEDAKPILIDGPSVTFEGQSDAVVSWSTPQPRESILEYRQPGEDPTVIRDDRPKRLHSIRLASLRRNTEYAYRIRLDEQLATEEYTLDTQFDYGIADLPEGEDPYPNDDLSPVYARATEYILRDSGIDRGYCIDYGCGEGRLGYEIARRSKLHVIGVSTDEQAVDAGRARLLAAGTYGARVTLRHVDSLDALPFTDLCANLVVSGEMIAGGRLPGAPGEVIGKLRPEGGKAYIGAPRGAALALTQGQLQEWLAGAEARIVKGRAGLWAVVHRAEPLDGAGEWTHAYGAADQAANSWDELVRGETGSTLEVQWFGRPGPDAMLDRQVRMQGPLSTAGRIFVQGNDRIIAMDSYNGAILWSVEIPHLRRTNIPRNTGNTCANDEYMFVAVRDRCWRLDADTGQRGMSYSVAHDEADTGHEWGYVATEGDQLFGSAVRRGSMESGFVGPQFWFDKRSGEHTHNVCSENLFADRISDGKRLWTYSGGLIINPTITIGGGRVYFIESRSPDAMESSARKLGPELWSDTQLVALDARTGKTLWQRPFEAGRETIIVYLVYHDEQIARITSYGGKYQVRTLGAAGGADRWRATHEWLRDNHGHHIQHPVIAQGKLFQEPNVYDWKTGEKIDIEFPGRGKCGTITAAANMLHYRDVNDEVWDLDSNTVSEFVRLRSNCWIGMISGGGLLMSPVSGGGCSCGWPVYTSMTYRTKDDY